MSRNLTEEVELYQTHWWRCNGPCQLRKPHFGIVRRSANTAPGPKEYWWADHQRKCGGTFIKFQEPEKKNKKMVVAQPKGDITKYITSTKNKNKLPSVEPRIVQISDIKSDLSKVQIKSNNTSTVVVSQKGVSNPLNIPVLKPPSFLTGKGYTIASTRVRSKSADVTEMVRNIWAKKQLTPNMVSQIANKNNYVQKPNVNASPKTAATTTSKDTIPKATKHKPDSEHVHAPPVKVKKIDDYFKKNVASILKDIYGSNIDVVESRNNNKLVAVINTRSSQVVQVDCPICRLKIEESKINTHLDECLNKDLIAKICDGNEVAPNSQVKSESVPPVNDINQPSSVVVNEVSKQVSKEILATLPPYKPKLQVKQDYPNGIDLMKKDLDKSLTAFKGTARNEIESWNNHFKTHIPKLDPGVVDKGKSVVKGQLDINQRKSDNFIVPKEEKDLRSGSSPSHVPKDVEVEPGPSKASSWWHQKCLCCGNLVTKPMGEHLEECLSFFDSEPPPDEAPANIANQTIVIDDDDDIFDESQVFNATGTKLPCPCCMQMVENDDMNAHLDNCLC